MRCRRRDPRLALAGCLGYLLGGTVFGAHLGDLIALGFDPADVTFSVIYDGFESLKTPTTAGTDRTAVPLF